MEEAWFLWKGQASSALGLRVLACPAARRAAAVLQWVEVPGRSGLLTLDGPPVYEAEERVIRFLLPPETPPEAVLSWLSGSGELVLGSEPNRALAAEAEDGVTLLRQPDRTWEGTVRFTVQPLKSEYPPQGEQLLGTTASGSVSVLARGDVPARPVYTVLGADDMQLTVGNASETGSGSVIQIILPEGETGVVIDTNAAMITNLSGETNLSYVCSLFYNGFKGMWLPPNEHTTISWNENVTQVRMDPRWRWL